jgi:hypothetical protein
MVKGFTRFTLAQIQLEPGGENKDENLKHTREMILRACNGDGDMARRPDLIMLPVSRIEALLRIGILQFPHSQFGP